MDYTLTPSMPDEYLEPAHELARQLIMLSSILMQFCLFNYSIFSSWNLQCTQTIFTLAVFISE